MSGDNNIGMDDLAKAFDSENKSGGKKGRRGARKKWPLALFCVGMVALIIGVVFAIARTNSQPPMEDAEFLMSAGEWVEEDQPLVIWDFIEAGVGKLSTDGHLNDYEFAWKLEDGKLTIDTAWLYNLNDTFDYTIDQWAKVLTITNEDKGIEVKFKARERTGETRAAQDAEASEAEPAQEAENDEAE